VLLERLLAPIRPVAGMAFEIRCMSRRAQVLPKSPVTIERSLAVVALEDGYVSRGNDMLMMHSLLAPEMVARAARKHCLMSAGLV
jgi:hypothetical protein